VKRREFITLLGGAAAAWPLMATTVVPSQAQRPAPTVGILNYAATGDVRVVQFLNALGELGYIEGRNIALVQRHADGALDKLPGLTEPAPAKTGRPRLPLRDACLAYASKSTARFHAVAS